MGVCVCVQVDVYVRCCGLDGDIAAEEKLLRAGTASGWSPDTAGGYLLYHVMSFSNSSSAITFGSVRPLLVMCVSIVID